MKQSNPVIRVVLLGGCFLHPALCQALIMFYGGDADFRTYLESAKNTLIEDARVYDDFTTSVRGGIHIAFGNFFVQGDYFPSQAHYEIRTNITEGNGGNVLRSATVPVVSVQLTGRSFRGMIEWRFRCRFPEFVLERNTTYWVSVAPVGNGSGHYYLSTTSGENSVGHPIGNGNSFFDSTFYGASFDRTEDWLGQGQNWDFSLGLEVVQNPRLSPGYRSDFSGSSGGGRDAESGV